MRHSQMACEERDMAQRAKVQGEGWGCETPAAQGVSRGACKQGMASCTSALSETYELKAADTTPLRCCCAQRQPAPRIGEKQQV